MDAVTKRYGAATVLNDITLTVAPGTVAAVTGANGSGKTTLLRIAATLSTPTFGSLSVQGIDAVRHAPEARGHIGAVMHSPMLYSELTVRENLSLFATLCQIDSASDIVDDVALRFRLTERMDEQVRRLSHGYRKRVSIARSVLHSPVLLLLDEPETGLDESSLSDLRDLVGEWRKGERAVLIATHDLDFAVASADVHYKLFNGRLESGD